MSFAAPLWLIGLGAVPVALFAYLHARRRARRFAVRFTAVTTLQLASEQGSRWRRWLPSLLALGAIAALAIAMARPRVRQRVAVDQGTVMLVTDHSGSMAASDVQPTRLLAAERAANTFIDQLSGNVSVGAIAFSGSPDAVQQPATDHRAARTIIDQQTANGATATGDALQLALQLLHGSDRRHPPSAIVLLSDGAANAGADPVEVARTSGRDRIPIDTVALGSANATVPNPDPLGPPLDASPDTQLMTQIARVSGGRTFNAERADRLSAIYKQLGTQLGSRTRQREVTVIFAAGGLVLLLLGAGASLRWSGRLP